MAHRSTPPLDPVPVDVKARRWTMRVIALLLLLQGAFLLGTAAVYLSRLNWEEVFDDVRLSVQTLDILLLVLLLGPIGIFDLATALAMWVGRPAAWFRAMLAQGTLLIFCLSSYIAQRAENFVYLLMLSCIIIVLYLNTNDVRITYQSSLRQRRDRRRRA